MANNKQLLADAKAFESSLHKLLGSASAHLLKGMEAAAKNATPEQKATLKEVAEKLKEANAHGKVAELNESIAKFKTTFNLK